MPCRWQMVSMFNGGREKPLELPKAPNRGPTPQNTIANIAHERSVWDVGQTKSKATQDPPNRSSCFISGGMSALMDHYHTGLTLRRFTFFFFAEGFCHEDNNVGRMQMWWSRQSPGFGSCPMPTLPGLRFSYPCSAHFGEQKAKCLPVKAT